MTRKELIREIIKKNGYHLDGDYTRNISKLEKAIDYNMINKKLDLWVYKTLKKANLSKKELKELNKKEVIIYYDVRYDGVTIKIKYRNKGPEVLRLAVKTYKY
jgi:hypothetical protein